MKKDHRLVKEHGMVSPRVIQTQKTNGAVVSMGVIRQRCGGVAPGFLDTSITEKLGKETYNALPGLDVCVCFHASGQESQ